MSNTRLVDYGIIQEKSDIRAHVSVAGKCVYVYPTNAGIEAIRKGSYRKAPAYTGDIKTAEGYLVPPKDISLCRTIEIPDHIMQKANFDEADTTTQKGDKAVRVVRWLLSTGRFPLWTDSRVIEDHDLQIDGMDIVVRMNTRIQVKCDWRAGNGQGCTGNLFLQVAECNPYGRH